MANMRAPAALCGLLAMALIGMAAAQVKVCLPFVATAAYTQNCTTTLNNNLGPNLTFSCLSGTSATNCMQLIRTGEADLAMFGGDELYTAYTEYSLLPVVAEDYGVDSDSASYYSVAITTKAFCDAQSTPPTLASLKGKNSCHTGYRKTSGWTLPVGYMISQAIMPPVDSIQEVTNDAESVANFFGTVCAPRSTSAGPRVIASGGALWTGPGTTCAGCTKGDCSAADPYQDYSGALRCLMEGGGDVAFAKHTTPTDYAKDSANPPAWATLNSADLRLICPTGGCAPVENWRTCNLAKAAAHAFVTRAEWRSSATGLAVAARMVAQAAPLLRDGTALGGQSGFIFQAGTTGLRALPPTTTFEQYFGPSAVLAYSSMRTLAVPEARWCTTSAADQAFCQQAIGLMNTANVGFRFSCVQQAGEDACLAAIKAGTADLRTFDGASIYNGNSVYDLKVIAGEDYGLSDSLEYYATALVPKAMCDANPTMTFANLKGLRSCHTGYRKSSGWTMPVGYMINSGIMPVVRGDSTVEDDAESVASFFSKSCVPRPTAGGPKNSADGLGAKYDKLCTACGGDCSGDVTKEPYYDYAGSMRCLTEGAGDVAFLKHTTPLEYAKDGSTPAPWATKDMGEYRLLCPSGGCRPVNQFLQCNVARVASHGVMVRGTYTHTLEMKAALVALSADPAFRALVFNSTANKGNYLFKSGTVKLLAVNDDTKTYLGNSVDVYKGLNELESSPNPPAAPAAAPAPSSGGSNLSGGAIAGIVIGCCVGTALIAALIAVMVMRRRQGAFQKYTPEAEVPQGKFVEHVPQSHV